MKQLAFLINTFIPSLRKFHKFQATFFKLNQLIFIVFFVYLP